MSSINNVLTIAQKEFADNVHSPKIRLLISALILILLSECIVLDRSGYYLFKGGSGQDLQIFGLFFPIFGLALGFDSIVKERNSDSLNTLLTHPVFRDNILAGKIAGGLVTLFIAITVSLAVSQGTILIYSGVSIQQEELNRLFIFALVSFIYLSSFIALGLVLSIVSREPARSFMYGIVIWIVLVLTFGGTAVTVASFISGGSVIGDDDENVNAAAVALYEDMQCLSLTNHYSMAVDGVNGMSQGNVQSSSESASLGIFDTSHSLSQWLNDYWTNITALVVTPLILFIISFVIFIKTDITR